MNPNIQVISENLWAVSFSYVKAGYIKELSFKPNEGNAGMSYTQDGKLILNKDDEIAMKYVKTLKVIMGFSDTLLNSERGFKIYLRAFFPSLDNLEDAEFIRFLESKRISIDAQKLIYEKTCNMEKERRMIEKAFRRKHWFRILLAKFIRKDGE
jgi:hypothetical protein